MKRFMTLMMALFTSATVLAQTQPGDTRRRKEQLTPPISMLEQARRFAGDLGKSAESEPSGVRTEMQEFTGDALWIISWAGQERGFAVTVNAITGRVVGYRVRDKSKDEAGKKAAEVALNSGQTFPITEAQAAATVRDMLRYADANAETKDWRVGSVGLDHWGDNAKLWGVGLYRVVEGKPCDLGSVYAQVNPIDGSVLYFSLTDTAIRLPQSGPLISHEQARKVAVEAWRKFGGPDSVSPSDVWKGVPYWKQFSETPLCRLAYAFDFAVKDEDGNAAIFGAVVDAETGELWSLKIETGGGAEIKFIPRHVKSSSRIAFAAVLLKAKEAAPLGRAIAAGCRLRKLRPAPKGKKSNAR